MSKFTINNNEKLIRNGGRKAVPLTAKELERKIFSAAEASGFDEEEDFGEILYALSCMIETNLIIAGLDFMK